MQFPDPATLRLTFDDEFDTFLNSPDGGTGTWMTSYPYSGLAARTLSGNSEGQYYSDASVGVNPFTLADGVLGITARPAPPGATPAGLPYTSGITTTDTSFSQTYGYFEVRALLPAGRGLWPAFWLLPASNAYTAELDVFEVLGHQPDVIYSSVHGGYGSTWATDIRANTAADTSNGFHTYGVDWEPDTTSFYLDGVLLSSAATPDSMDTPMFMLLNLAVGNTGSWPGAPDNTTTFPATMHIDYVRAYATAATRDASGAAAIAPATTLGQGPDTLTLSIAGDAWQGDPRFTVAVDGRQIGGAQTVAAAHAAGAVQTFSFKGDFTAGRHGVVVSFINDAYGGPLDADRNLFVTGATLNGAALPDAAVALFNNGSGGFSFAAAAPAPAADPISGPTLIGTGSDTLMLRMSEDAWQGDAQFTITVDGRQVGGVQTVTASRAAGQEQVFNVRGDFAAGSHVVLVSFLNDAYGGTADTDRNLFVAGAAFNGTAVADAAVALTRGPGSFSFTQPAPAAPEIVQLRLQAYDWRSHALLAGVSASVAGGGSTAVVSTGADGIAAVGVTPGSHVITAVRSADDAGRAITAADALAALHIAVGLNPNAPPGADGAVAAPQVSPYQLLAADVNGDGRVTAADALAILRMAVKLPGAPVPRWIFVDEANSTWDPATLRFIPTRSSVTPAAPIAASIAADTRIGLAGVLTGAVLGRWVPPPGSASLPTAYFQALSLAGGVPMDQWGYGAAISGLAVAAVGLPTSGTVIYDTAVNIATGLDQLQAWHAAGLLTGLIFMDTTPVLPISIAQFINDQGALSAASGVFRLDIGPGANTASLSGAGVMTILGQADVVAARTVAATIHYTLAPATGVETIAEFHYGIDRLDIDLAGHAAADLLATDVVLAGAPAIALGAAADPAHAVVLTGILGTAAEMVSFHLTFGNGHALIT
jgi:beta-glucanase (GH16 family)